MCSNHVTGHCENFRFKNQPSILTFSAFNTTFPTFHLYYLSLLSILYTYIYIYICVCVRVCVCVCVCVCVLFGSVKPELGVIFKEKGNISTLIVETSKIS